MFNILPILFIGLFCLMVFLAIKDFMTNKNSPELSVMARVLDKRKRTNVDQNNNVSSHTTNYYVDFQVESGDILKLKVSRSEYVEINIGDMGKLTFQGSWFKSFSKDF